MRLLDEKNNCRDHFVQRANPQTRPYIRIGQEVMLLVVAPTSCKKKHSRWSKLAAIQLPYSSCARWPISRSRSRYAKHDPSNDGSDR